MLMGETASRPGTGPTTDGVDDVGVYRRSRPQPTLVALLLLVANPALRGKCSVT